MFRQSQPGVCPRSILLSHAATGILVLLSILLLTLASGPALCHIPACTASMHRCSSCPHTCRLLAAWYWQSPTAMRPGSSFTATTSSAGSGQRLRLCRLGGRQNWLAGKSCCAHQCPATTESASNCVILLCMLGPYVSAHKLLCCCHRLADDLKAFMAMKIYV